MLLRTLHISWSLAIFLTLSSGTIAPDDPLTTIYHDAQDVPNTQDPTKSAAQEVKHPAPPSVPDSILNIELTSARGGPFKLSDYSGSVIVLHFWATWCGPCRLATPELVKLQTKFRSRGVKMIELSTEDPKLSASDVRHWIRSYKVNYRVGWATKEVASTLMQANGSIPQVFVIGRDGQIVKRFIGFSKVRTPPLLMQAIEEALKQP